MATPASNADDEPAGSADGRSPEPPPRERPGAGLSRALPPQRRDEIVTTLRGHVGSLTTKVVEAMEARHSWFRRLGAEDRSWITIVARAGIDNFMAWFADAGRAADPGTLFNAAPRALTRKVSLHQTVDLVRTTINVVAEQVGELVPPDDRPALELAITHFSREVAFATAEVYARAAELRGGWDERMEALIVDAIVRAETDDLVVSRASALGWNTLGPVCVIVGPRPAEPDLESLRTAASARDLTVLASEQGGRIIVIVGGALLTDTAASVRLAQDLEEYFGAGSIVVGPLVKALPQATDSAQSALSASRVAHAWPEAPRVVASFELLPERALAGHPAARRKLVDDVYRPLAAAGGELLATTIGFLDNGCAIEPTARALFVHANTVRYRLHKVEEITRMNPLDPRQAYALHLAITLGRLMVTDPASSSQ